MTNHAHLSTTNYFGIDVSKDTLVVAQLLASGEYKVQDYDNTEPDIEKLLSFLQSLENSFVTLEATGNYSMKVTFALSEAQIPVAMLNPKQSKGFIDGVMLSTTKTDPKDACALALYGKINQPCIYKIPEPKILEIKQLRTALRQLKKQIVMTSNQLHALQYHAKPADFVVGLLSQNLNHFKAQIKQIEEKLCQISEENFQRLYQLALTVKGIGPATAVALLMITNGCQGFENAKQLAKFLGVCPTQKESGSSIRFRGSMAKTGDPSVRALLYMGARSAKRYNLACKDLYERLRAKGKCHKVAMNAVCHKMVKQFFAVITKEIPFDNEWQLKTQKS